MNEAQREYILATLVYNLKHRLNPRQDLYEITQNMIPTPNFEEVKQLIETYMNYFTPKEEELFKF